LDLAVGITAFAMLAWLAAFALAIALFAFWIWMLVDCLLRQFRDPTTKLIWALVIIFVHFIGALIYFFVGRPTGTIPGRPQPAS
jgi:glucan phosphoethanolaminetransferase (alkaline phosphatase superfamily)